MSRQYAGKRFLLQVEDAKVVDTFKTVGGMQEKSVTSNVELIETTDHGSNDERELLEGAGVGSTDISASGIDGDYDTLVQIEDDKEQRMKRRYRWIDQQGNGWSQLFMVESIEKSGPVTEAMKWTLSLKSSGPKTKLKNVVLPVGP